MMKIGEVIRKYRKEKQMTQEEMAGCLGVTAPAVNKWENGNSYPDILLLAPIARLLGISTDMLLSYKEDLTDEEINRLLEETVDKIKKEGYENTFRWAESIIQEYPNCFRLIFYLTQALDSYRVIYSIHAPECYDDRIRKLYERVLECPDDNIVQSCAAGLYTFYMNKKDYVKAGEYLARIPAGGYNTRQMQANLYVRQGKTEEAYPLYEQIVFAGFNDINGALNGLLDLAMKENDIPKAEWIVEKQKNLASLLEMGPYMEASPGLNLALYSREIFDSQDKEEILRILSDAVHSIKEMDSFKTSKLYSHVRFSDNGTGTIALMFLNALENDESISFIKEDERYRKLLDELRSMQQEGHSMSR